MWYYLSVKDHISALKKTKLCTQQWYFLLVARVNTILFKTRSALRKTVQSKIILCYLLLLEVYTHLFFCLHCFDDDEWHIQLRASITKTLALALLLNVLPPFLALYLLCWRYIGMFLLPSHVRRLQMNKKWNVCVSIERCNHKILWWHERHVSFTEKVELSNMIHMALISKIFKVLLYISNLACPHSNIDITQQSPYPSVFLANSSIYTSLFWCRAISVAKARDPCRSKKWHASHAQVQPFHCSLASTEWSKLCFRCLLSRQLENGYTPRTYMQEFHHRYLAPWKCFPVQHDKRTRTYTDTTHGQPFSREVLFLLGVSIQSCALQNFKDRPWYVSGTCVFLIFPHIFVWGSCFWLCTHACLLPPRPPPAHTT